eukprot:TRINITY_DN93646_c0_g1_i1.p1 TRINITY_DN93646_c0_g1~~TRINITY_DN93646_c0_g1_i1.p1  ORF type:complete len:1717 (+),score=245.38 TRINITY_DN93646_c0_g1_i1:46-5196(+)
MSSPAWTEHHPQEAQAPFSFLSRQGQKMPTDLLWTDQRPPLPPSCKVEVANGVLQLAFLIATQGVNGFPAKGFLMVVMDIESFRSDKWGTCSGFNKYSENDPIHVDRVLPETDEWEFVVQDFMMDRAMVIDGSTGQILASQWVVKELASGGDEGGTKRKAASAVAIDGKCFALKCSEDSCRCDGQPTASCKFEVFPGVKCPEYVWLASQAARNPSEEASHAPESCYADFDNKGFPVWDSLPPKGCEPSVITEALRVASKISTEGVGEKTPANGFLLMIGEPEKFNDELLWHRNKYQKYVKATTLGSVLVDDKLMTNFKADFLNNKGIAISGKDGTIIHHLIVPKGYEHGFRDERARFRCARDLAEKHQVFVISCARDACGVDGCSTGFLSIFPGTSSGECITVATRKDVGKGNSTFKTKQEWDLYLSTQSIGSLSQCTIADDKLELYKPDEVDDQLKRSANADISFPLHLVHSDRASFMYLVFEPSVTLGDASNTRLANQMYAVTQEARNQIREGELLYPVLVADAEHARANLAELALADVVVWCSEGIPLEDAQDANRSSSSRSDICGVLKLLQNASLLVVCLKHGACHAAKVLRQAMACPVIWFEADMLTCKSPGHLFNIIAYAIQQAYGRRIADMPWKPRVEQQLKRKCEQCPYLQTEVRGFDLECEGDERQALRALFQRARSQKEGTRSCSCLTTSNRVYVTNLLHGSLDDDLDLELLECDSEEPARVCKQLEEEQQSNLQLKCEAATSLSRCRSVACQVCRALLRSDGYDIIFRIANEDDVETLVAKVSRAQQRTHVKSLRALLWVDHALDAQAIYAKIIQRTRAVAVDVRFLITSSEAQSLDNLKQMKLASHALGEAITCKDARSFSIVLKHCLKDCPDSMIGSRVKATLSEILSSHGLNDISVRCAYVATDSMTADTEVDVAVCLRIPKVQSLQRLCSAMLFSKEVEAKLKPMAVDASRFTDAYIQLTQRFDRLTAGQSRILDRMRSCLEKAPRVHLQAVAGAGKTFIAMHLMLGILIPRQHVSTGAKILYMSTNPGLCYHVVHWLAARVQNDHGYTWDFFRDVVLPSVHILFEPDSSDHPSAVPKPQQLYYSVATQKLEHAETFDDMSKYELIIVDEAHWLEDTFVTERVTEQFPVLTRAVQDRIENASPDQKMLFLSDISQGLGAAFDFAVTPDCQLKLSEVVRSSKRVVAAARAFKLSDDPAQFEECLRDTPDGMPLNTYLFDGGGTWEKLTPNDYLRYAQEVERAIDGLKTTCPVPDLHNLVAIIVPDSDFRHGLAQVLKSDSCTLKFEFEFVSALEACKTINRPQRYPNEKALCVFDSVDRFAGLERQIVIAVGLDKPSWLTRVTHSSESAATVRATARCQIFQALTRAQMTAIVVNARIIGGWLEFLLNLEFKKDSQYDDDSEKLSMEKFAASSHLERDVERDVEQASPKTAASHRQTIAPSQYLPPSAVAEVTGVVQRIVQKRTAGSRGAPTKIWKTGIWNPSGNSVGPVLGLYYDPIIRQRSDGFDEDGAPVWHACWHRGNSLPRSCREDVVNAVLKLASEIATKGLGGKTASPGFFLILGDKERLIALGTFQVLNNKYNWKYQNSQIFVGSLDEKDRRLITPAFAEDGALIIDGDTGQVLGSEWVVSGQVLGSAWRASDVEKKGESGKGLKHEAASAIAQEGFFSLTCSGDICSYDDRALGDFKIFPGTREGLSVPVREF